VVLPCGEVNADLRQDQSRTAAALRDLLAPVNRLLSVATAGTRDPA